MHFFITQYLSLFIRPYEYHIHTKTEKGHFSSDRIVSASSCPLRAIEGTILSPFGAKSTQAFGWVCGRHSVTCIVLVGIVYGVWG